LHYYGDKNDSRMHMKMGVLCSLSEKSSEWTVLRQTSYYT